MSISFETTYGCLSTYLQEKAEVVEVFVSDVGRDLIFYKSNFQRLYHWSARRNGPPLSFAILSLFSAEFDGTNHNVNDASHSVYGSLSARFSLRWIRFASPFLTDVDWIMEGLLSDGLIFFCV